ncbi:hypothetical protein NKR23_g6431 [Pleurostoma richardsiae]|uniref:Uncharacterized protein n=1 Tax=Pleurostoma richardsiae TaxID=41990 RepID=A0AA38VPC8_9PEZI|nr:hypothetical protein NKR23_g6431 [Pleurostoma richardsiae]
MATETQPATNVAPVGTPINYQDWIRFKTADNRYLSLAVVSVESGGICFVTVVDQPNDDCNFLIRDWDWDPTKPFPYSGNVDADTPDCHGNFRLIHRDTRPNPVPEKFCVSIHTDESQWDLVSSLYWGVDWDVAYDLETFTLFKADDEGNDDQVKSGDFVKLRSMAGAKKVPNLGSIGAFLRIGQFDGQWRVYIPDPHYFQVGDTFVVEKVTPGE